MVNHFCYFQMHLDRALFDKVMIVDCNFQFKLYISYAINFFFFVYINCAPHRIVHYYFTRIGIHL